MTTRFKVLVVEDEQSGMQLYLNALAERYEMVHARTGDVFLAQYGRARYDALILDLMLPGWEGFPQPGPDAEFLRGKALYFYVRSIDTTTPIIVLTNVSNPEVDATFTGDRRTRVLRKGAVRPFTLVERVASIIKEWPHQNGLEINPTPYFVQDADSGKQVPMYFAPFTDRDMPMFLHEWKDARYALNFKAYSEIPTEQRNIFKLVENHNEDGRPHGLLYTGGELEQWHASVIFESAPWNVFGSKNRQFRNVGKALVTRIVRESMARGMRGAFAFSANGQSHFFERLAMQPLPQWPELYVLSHARAMELLQELGTG